MRFTFVTVALAAVAGLVQAQSSTRASSSGATSKGSSTTGAATSSITPGLNPNVNNICLSYAINIPACGLAALTSLGSKLNGCGPYDFQCQCDVSKQLQDAASSPVIAACGIDTALQVQGAANSICECVTANNAPLTTSSRAVAVPAYVKARATDAAGLFSALVPAVVAGAGVIAAL